MAKWLHSISCKVNESRDPASLGVARFFFGLLMIVDIFDERGLVRLPMKYGDPDACYFPLFDGLPKLSIEYLYMVYLALLLSAFGIMIGFFYKISCAVFMVSYWYIFFLDKTVWNNHSYLYGLLSILLLLCNANYYWSVDGILWPSIRNKKIPAWQYGMLRFQVFILYFYAGLKKLDRDWISGYSMTGLSRKWIFDPFRMFLSNDQIDFFMVHCCGLVFDLTQGFLLLSDQGRKFAFFFGYMFHGMNAIMFSIGMFSYMCMALLPIFCKTDWPKDIIKKAPSFMQCILPLTASPQENRNCSDFLEEEEKEKKSRKKKPWKQTFSTLFVNLVCLEYIIVQLFLPYSHFLTKGYNSWTQGLYGYSWDMMIHSWNTQHVVVKVVDKNNGNKQYLRPGAFFPFGDSKTRIFSHPDMLKQYATCLVNRIQEMDELNISKPQVYFDVWKSMNGRYHQRMVDPLVDIASAEWSPFKETTWIKPLLVELSSWRGTLKAIRSVNYASSNATEVVFVADFPGLFLENFIAPEINGNVTVLSGKITVESEEKKNTTVKLNETLTLVSDSTHTIYTVSDEPSCYMYTYYNTTWVDKTEEDVLASDPEMRKKKEANEKWERLSLYEKFYNFISKKLRNVRHGLHQIHFALMMILEFESIEDSQNSNDSQGEL